MAVPYLPSIISDGMFHLTTYKTHGLEDPLCLKLGYKLNDCLEAYGLEKGKNKCAELFFDLCECKTKLFQRKRYRAIQDERMKQYRAGKLKTPFEENPPLESFLSL